MTPDPSTLRIILTQFQARYPTGCLISELLQIHQNTYAVKVSVQVEGQTLATGMAAAEVLELAEDRARVRALEVLGLSAPSSGQQNPDSGAGITPLPPLEALSYAPLPPLPPVVEAVQSYPTPGLEDTLSKEAQAYPALTLDPIDLSDAITQTTVEIKRLGWTESQGRSYLKETYAKRSRAELTNEELLEFLEFLQSQPSPERP